MPAAQVWPRASEYIARSTLMPIPFVTSIKAPKASFCSSGAALLTSTLKREVGRDREGLHDRRAVLPQECDLDVGRGRAGVRQQDVGLESLGHADAAFGQAPLRVDKAVEPKLLWASAQVEGGPGQYIARSAITGWSDAIVVDTAALASSGSSCLDVHRQAAVGRHGLGPHDGLPGRR